MTKKKKIVTGVIYKAFKKHCNTHTRTQQRTFRNCRAQEKKSIKHSNWTIVLNLASVFHFTFCKVHVLTYCLAFIFPIQKLKGSESRNTKHNYQQCYLSLELVIQYGKIEIPIQNPQFCKKVLKSTIQSQSGFCPSRCWAWAYRRFSFKRIRFHSFPVVSNTGVSIHQNRNKRSWFVTTMFKVIVLMLVNLPTASGF